MLATWVPISPPGSRQRATDTRPMYDVSGSTSIVARMSAMIAVLLAIVIGQLPILPPIIFNENSKADVATVAYLGEFERFHDRVKRLQRDIEREPDEQRREVLCDRLREYQRDVVPLLESIRRSVQRLRVKERGPGEFAA